jgi:hypothetical protein
MDVRRSWQRACDLVVARPGSGCATAKEMQNHEHDRDDQQEMDECGRQVEGEKAESPEDHQDQGDESEHSWLRQK